MTEDILAQFDEQLSEAEMMTVIPLPNWYYI